MGPQVQMQPNNLFYAALLSKPGKRAKLGRSAEAALPQLQMGANNSLYGVLLSKPRSNGAQHFTGGISWTFQR